MSSNPLPAISLRRRHLDQLAANVARPQFDLNARGKKHLHIGLGHFHRAHQAFYNQRVLVYEPQWGIVGVNLRSQDRLKDLAQQDHLYSLLSQDHKQSRLEVIASICETLHAPTQREEFFQAFREAELVTLTITEKGYDDQLSDSGPSAIQWLAEALEFRNADRARPLNIISCDNLQHNGDRLKQSLERYFHKNPGGWKDIQKATAFLNSMVDRIVPASKDST